jgi:hypothetical protein
LPLTTTALELITPSKRALRANGFGLNLRDPRATEQLLAYSASGSSPG